MTIEKSGRRRIESWFRISPVLDERIIAEAERIAWG